MNSNKFRHNISKLLLPISYLFPVKKGRVLLKSFDLKYSCNTKYICEYLIKNHPDIFEPIYIINDKKTENCLKSKGVKSVRDKSLKYFYYAFTAQFFITTFSYPLYLPKKRSQTVIETTHGCGLYKRLINSDDSKWEHAKTDVCLSFADMLNRDGQLLKERHFTDEQILNAGSPRADIFFDKSYKCPDVKKILGIDESKKILLYAPTFHKEWKKRHIPDEFKNVLQACEKKFGGEFVLVNRDHNFDLNCNNKEANDSYVYESNVIDDAQELIYSADVIITDYSSLMWDASFSGHPCFIYAYDLEEYYKTWTFYDPIEKWPFPVAQTLSELEDKISNFDGNDYNEKIRQYHERVGSFENGTACRQVAEYMMKKL